MTAAPPAGSEAGPQHRRPDLRLLAPAVGGWLAAAWAVGEPAGRSLPLSAAVGGLGLVLLGGRRAVVARVPAAACLVCVAGCLAAAGLRVYALRHGPLRELAGAHAGAELSVVVTGDPRAVAGKPRGSSRPLDLVVVPARAERVRAGAVSAGVRQPVLLLASGPGWTELLPSQHLLAAGRLAPARRGDMTSAVLVARGPPAQVGPPSTLQRTAGRLRAGLRQAAAPLPAAERGLVPGLVDGDVSGLDPQLREDFRTTGLTHLTAVSGSNVAIVLSVSLLVARRLRAGPRLAPTLAALALAGFVLLARPEPSVLRAAVMGAVGVAAVISGRQRSALPTLCAAVLALVLIDPALARSPGFALSVLATGGLLVLAPGWRDRLAVHMPRAVAEAIAIPAAAQLACGPVIAVISAQVSLVSVPANLLAAPAVAPATVLGVLAALAAVVCMPLARLFAWLSSFPTGWLVTVARHGARVPAGAFGWPSGMRGGLLLAACSVALLVVLGRRRLRRPIAAVTAGTTLSVVGLQAVAPSWPPPDWAMVVCDVGQGDGIVVSAGAGAAVVIDTGPDPAAMNRCLTSLGVRRVPLLLLTHLHADHVEGVPGVLRGRRVEEAEVGPLDEPPDERIRLTGWLAGAGVPANRASPGEQRSVGPVTWTVLAPQAAFHGTSSDPNNSSLVLRMELAGATVLLTGDVEWQAQRAMLSSGVDVRATVLKVPHHGSDHQDPDFLDAVGAGLAVTSVGKGNSYGHPSPNTLDRVRRDGMRSYRTDDDGDVALVPGHGVLSAVARHGSGAAATVASGTRLVRPDQHPATHSLFGARASAASRATVGSAALVVPLAGSDGRGGPGRSRLVGRGSASGRPPAEPAETSRRRSAVARGPPHASRRAARPDTAGDWGSRPPSTHHRGSIEA